MMSELIKIHLGPQTSSKTGLNGLLYPGASCGSLAASSLPDSFYALYSANEVIRTLRLMHDVLEVPKALVLGAQRL